jgi:hypothetical protein
MAMTKFTQMGSAIVNVECIEGITFGNGAIWLSIKGSKQPNEIPLSQPEQAILLQKLLGYGADSDGK